MQSYTEVYTGSNWFYKAEFEVYTVVLKNTWVANEEYTGCYWSLTDSYRNLYWYWS